MRAQRGFTLIELMIVVTIIAILAAIAIGQYQDYVIRAQVAEAASLASGAKTAVGEFQNNYGRYGSNNRSLGLAQPASIVGKYVDQVDASGGPIVARFGNEANAAIAGQTLSFSPVTRGGSLEWVCNPSGGLAEKYVPSACRN